LIVKIAGLTIDIQCNLCVLCERQDFLKNEKRVIDSISYNNPYLMEYKGGLNMMAYICEVFSSSKVIFGMPPSLFIFPSSQKLAID
jgi:hypothetical protein